MLAEPDAPTATDALAALRALPAGLHHRAAGGAWLMAGRALPAAFDWVSVPPAPSVSFVWGAGGCRVVHAGGAVDLAPGGLLWVAAGHPHRGQGAPGSDFLTLFVPAWAAAPPGAGVLPAAGPLGPALCRVAAAVLAGAGPATLDAALRDVAALAAPAAPRLVPRALRAARAHLDAHYREDEPISAAAPGLAAWSLSRRFAAAWGLPPAQYRKQLRLLHATRALLGGASVQEAAHGAGFADAPHLVRSFRAQYGVAPGAWQAAVRGGLAGRG